MNKLNSNQISPKIKVRSYLNQSAWIFVICSTIGLNSVYAHSPHPYFGFTERFSTTKLIKETKHIQDITISGKVSDREGPLAGASVVVKGTTIGTQTDFDGNYTLGNVDDSAILVFSYIGYETIEIGINDQSIINVTLEQDAQALDEIVLIGYGSTTKKEITSAVTVVNEEEFNKGVINDASQLLQGKVSGLSIYNKGGNPNQPAVIRLRGISTVGANTSPLVVIDGVVGSSLENVDPNDIASINVLKDGSAAAIYGTRGSSGVILVTTKRGSAGEVKIEYNGQLAVSSIFNKVDIMTPDEFIASGGINLESKNDWVDNVTRQAVTHIHNISVSGGQGKTNYRFSGNLRDAEGIVINTGFEQANFRANLTTRALNDKLRIDFNSSYTKRDSDFGYDAVLRQANQFNPTAPILGDDSPFIFNSEQFGGYFETLGLFDSFNPVGIANQNTNRGSRNQFNYNIALNYDLTDNWAVNATYGSQSIKNVRREYNPTTDLAFGNAANPLRKGRAALGTRESEFKLFEMYTTWKKNINEIDLSLTGGYSFQEDNFTDYFVELRDFPDETIDYINAIEFSQDLLGTGLVNATSDASPNDKIIAFFGRANVTFDNAIFLSTSLRREGSTKLGADNQWGLFPSVGLGADLNRYLNLSNVTLFKVRLGYGVTGALPQDYGLSQEIRSITYDSNTGAASSTLQRAANPDLQWEEKAETNLGVEFNTNRLSAVLDLYTRDISEFILNRQVEISEFGVDRRFENVGKLNTKGLELAVNYDIVQKENVNFNSGIVFSTYKTILDEYIQDQETRGNLGSPGQNGTNMILIREGEEIGQIWGPVFSGEVVGGDQQFVDINGDGNLVTNPGQALDDDADFAVLGNGIPDFELGWTNQLQFGSWEVNAFFRGAFGHSLVNTYRAFFEPRVSNQASYNYVNTEFANPDITSARFSSLYVEKADFFMLDNLTVSKRFDFGENKYINGIRLSANVQNAFTITNYTGADPEPALTDVGDVLAPGIDRRNNYFSARTFTIGLNINF